MCCTKSSTYLRAYLVRRATHWTGAAIREAGLKLDRVGLLLQGKFAYRERCKCCWMNSDLSCKAACAYISSVHYHIHINISCSNFRSHFTFWFKTTSIIHLFPCSCFDAVPLHLALCVSSFLFSCTHPFLQCLAIEDSRPSISKHPTLGRALSLHPMLH